MQGRSMLRPTSPLLNRIGLILLDGVVRFPAGGSRLPVLIGAVCG